MSPHQLAAYRDSLLTFAADVRLPSGRRFGDVWTPFQLGFLKVAEPSVLAIERGEKPPIGRFFLECTKGLGKNWLTAIIESHVALFSKRPIHGQNAAADFDQASGSKRSAEEVRQGIDRELAERIDIQAKRIFSEHTGVDIEVVTTDAAGTQGARAMLVVVDELSCMMSKAAEEVASNLLDNSAKVDGIVILATNAGFTGTWQWKWRELARTSPRWSFHHFAEPAPWLDPAEIAEAQQRNSQTRFMRLWHGVWSSGAGDALDAADIAAAVRPGLLPLTVPPTNERPWYIHPAMWKPAPTVSYSWRGGLDLGIRHDRSAFIVIGLDGANQRYRLAECKSWAPGKGGTVDLEAVEAAVLDAHKRFRLSSISFDPWQCALMAQRLRRQGVPMIEVPFTGSNLNTMATTILDVFRSRRIDLFDCKLVADLKRLTIVERSYGYKLESTRDADGHADCATALALALPPGNEIPTHTGGSWGGALPANTGYGNGFGGLRFSQSDGPKW